MHSNDILGMDVGQVRYGARREQHAERVRFCLLRLQQGVATLHLPKLSGDGLGNDIGGVAVAVGGRESRRLRRRNGVQAVGQRAGRRPSAGVVAELQQAEQLRIVQLDDARSADRPLIRTAEAYSLDGREL